MQATFYCHKQVITALLEAGADPTLAGHNGCTALGENKLNISSVADTSL